MSYKEKCTKGPVTIDQKEPHRVLGKSGSMGQNTKPIAECPGYQREREANAELIAEAFNVLHETGYTPAELAEQVGELRHALQRLGLAAGGHLQALQKREAELGGAWKWGEHKYQEDARAILSKYQPVTPA